ncbi:MAG: TAXI family TRAP transporter solute-binding subunit [Albidovulum sp.]|nr:TAXI family TRAP transporter solute-binding subunit [Albidovulum sp.]MDE0530938.1 TAXI family TRAP transporter solute-binding subunit [Albidovulum sp.]
MKFFRKLGFFAAVAVFAAAAGAQERLRMATIAPGSSAYLVMTSMASIVNSNQDEVEISVDATGAATKHIVEMAQGKLDLVMTSPAVYMFMSAGKAMYQKLENAPELAKNAGLVFWFPYGAYHVLAYEDSGITTLEDLRGKKVFLGPPGGGAWNAAHQWVEATTGMKAGEDYENVKASWGAALQGFQDRQFDVYVNGGIPPFPQVEQLALTSELRIIGLTKEQVDSASDETLAPTRVLGRKLSVIPGGIYGENVASDGDVFTLGATVGVTARMDLSDDLVYAATKAFWENLDEARKTSPFLNRVRLEDAFVAENLPLHPGARRYYEEIGAAIPESLK